MGFDVRINSQDMLRPVFHFPGDETIDTSQYQDVISRGYVSSVSSISGAAEGFGLQIDSETFERWKRITSCAGLLDNFLDENPDRVIAKNQYCRAINNYMEDLNVSIGRVGYDEKLIISASLLKNCVNGLDEEKLKKIKHASIVIGGIVLEKMCTDDIARYVTILKDEADYTSILITASTSYDVEEQLNFAAFEVWCRKALAFATYADASRDLGKDFRSKITKVVPTIHNRLVLARCSYQTARTMYKSELMRSASLHAVTARSRYSCLPTKLAVALHRPSEKANYE